jgi:hypothetical protein
MLLPCIPAVSPKKSLLYRLGNPVLDHDKKICCVTIRKPEIVGALRQSVRVIPVVALR